MECADGKRVNIRYSCRLQDGRVYLVGERNTLEFVLGSGRVPRALEAGLMGMQAGDARVVRVPHGELASFPFPAGSHFADEASPGIAYDFGPGNGGDVSLSLPGRQKQHQPIPAGADLLFEVAVLSVQEAGVGGKE